MHAICSVSLEKPGPASKLASLPQASFLPSTVISVSLLTKLPLSGITSFQIGLPHVPSPSPPAGPSPTQNCPSEISQGKTPTQVALTPKFMHFKVAQWYTHNIIQVSIF